MAVVVTRGAICGVVRASVLISNGRWLGSGQS